MRLQKTQIIAALIAAALSFALYLSPLSPFLLNLDQAHEVLLAVFGAGVSILFAELINYVYHSRELEKGLLESAEPLVSSLVDLGDLVIENAGDDVDSVVLLVDYLRGEESNALSASGCWPFAPGHASRNRLICAVEGYSEDDCDRFAGDPDSSFCRYVLRAKSSLDDLSRKYWWCDKAFRTSGREIDDKLAKISYLSGMFAEVPVLRHLPGAKKTRLLKDFKLNKEALEDALESTFRQVRLFYAEDKSYAELLEAFVKSRDIFKTVLDGACSLGEGCAMKLFVPLAGFASLAKADAAKRYKQPWW